MVLVILQVQSQFRCHLSKKQRFDDNTTAIIEDPQWKENVVPDFFYILQYQHLQTKTASSVCKLTILKGGPVENIVIRIYSCVLRANVERHHNTWVDSINNKGGSTELPGMPIVVFLKFTTL